MSIDKSQIDAESLWAAPTVAGWDPGISSHSEDGLPGFPADLQHYSGHKLVEKLAMATLTPMPECLQAIFDQPIAEEQRGLEQTK